MKSLQSQIKQVFLSPFNVLASAVIFVLALGLACNTPSAGDSNATQIALNVQATRLAEGQTQTIQAEEIEKTAKALAQQEKKATEDAQAATQVVLDAQATINAKPSDTPIPSNTPLPTNTPQPTNTVDPQASSGAQAPSGGQTTINQADFDTWMRSASILLFEDMTGDFTVTRYIQQALDGMGLKQYVDVRDALGIYKTQLLSGGPGGAGWDLIISGKELRTAVQGEFYVYINDALNLGSSVIIEEWDMDGIAAGKISTVLSRCGVQFHRDWMDNNIDRHLLFPVDGTHPVHHNPNEGIALTNPSGYWLGSDLGDWMRISPGSSAIPLWTARVNVKDSYLTAVTCLDGRLIIQTYSSHSYGQDRIIRMWQNYIYNTLKARYEYLAAQP